jgi:hypothetical protein
LTIGSGSGEGVGPGAQAVRPSGVRLLDPVHRSKGLKRPGASTRPYATGRSQLGHRP